MSTTATHPQLAFVFPGQGSQSMGMMSELAAQFPCVGERFGAASEVLGFDLWALTQEGPEEALNSTANTQPALLAASVASWDIWLACGGPRPAVMAGHSFGEYSALVCAGALDYRDAVALVAARGRFMQEAVPQGAGAMAAILGLDLDAVQSACSAASGAGELATCANLNAPGQIVIAGTRGGVAAACELASAAGAKRAMTLAVSAPAHCELMRPAAERLAARLAETRFSAPNTPIIHNVDVAAHHAATEIRDVLVRQMVSPVRWIETIEHFTAAGMTQVVECGPGKVLSALIKRIDRALACSALADGATIRSTIDTLSGEAA